MRRLIILPVLITALLFILAGCGGADTGLFGLEERFQGDYIRPADLEPPEDGWVAAAANEGEMIVIGERFFINEMFEIVLNYQHYLGRVLQFEGVFLNFHWNNQDFFVVTRFMQGCCDEEMIGLEVILGDIEPVGDDTWVEVTGVLDVLDSGFLVLRLIEMSQPAVRGAEIVF